MNLRTALLLGIAASTLMASLPAAARDNFDSGSFQIARRGSDDGFRSDRDEDGRRSYRRSDDGHGYGFGYERRRQSRDDNGTDDGADNRDRRQDEDRGNRRDRRNDRRDNGGRR